MSGQQSIHRVTSAWRWATVLLVPPLVALMGWAIVEVIGNYRAGDKDVSLLVATFAVVMFGGLALVFVAALLFAFRGRIVLDADTMTLTGAFRSTVIPAERLNGYRYISGKLYVFVKDKKIGMQLGYVEDMYAVGKWVRERTHDVAAAALAEEDAGIAADMHLGMTEAQRDQRLDVLQRRVKIANAVVYVAAIAAFGNAWFLDDALVERLTFTALALVPLWLDGLALANRGHVRVDDEDGSRYPQILTATVISGATLALLALTRRGGLVDNEFYGLFGVVLVLKWLLWIYIDTGRLMVLRARGRLVFAFSLLAMLAMPAFWVGGALYFANQYLDTSGVTWHETTVIEAKKHSSRITTYEVVLSPWNDIVAEPVEVTVSKREYEALEPGMKVEVAVRKGAANVPWVADLRPVGRHE